MTLSLVRGDGPFQAVPRAHVADGVFEQLARAILRGELAPKTALPPERVLADRFHTSRVIVRQAVHRLADVGLVKVKQGGSTVVLEPDEASDIRVIELFYRLGASSPPSARDMRDMTERQILQGLALLQIAALRATDAQLDELEALIQLYATSTDLERDFLPFEEHFWKTVARAGGNRITVLETAWWYRLLADRPDAQHVRFVPPEVRIAFYRELVRRLRTREDVGHFYLSTSMPFLELLSKTTDSQQEEVAK